MSTANAEPTPATHPFTGTRSWTLEGPHLDLDLAPEMVDFMNHLLRDTGDSPEELFRKALGLYRLAIDAKREGKVVGVATSADALETEVIL